MPGCGCLLIVIIIIWVTYTKLYKTIWHLKIISWYYIKPLVILYQTFINTLSAHSSTMASSKKVKVHGEGLFDDVLSEYAGSKGHHRRVEMWERVQIRWTLKPHLPSMASPKYIGLPDILTLRVARKSRTRPDVSHGWWLTPSEANSKSDAWHIVKKLESHNTRFSWFFSSLMSLIPAFLGYIVGINV